MLWRITLLVVCELSLDAQAVVVDRLAVIVAKHAIKASNIDLDLRLTEFLNREKLDLGPEARRKAAERLIDQTIIRDEVASGAYRRPADADTDALLKQLVKDRFAASDQKLRQSLATYGLTEAQLRDQLRWQLTVLRFIDQRFRPSVVVSDEEVRAYFEEHKAELQRQSPGSFESLEPRIRASLEGERINQNFVEWLEQARKRNRIEFKAGAFQ